MFLTVSSQMLNCYFFIIFLVCSIGLFSAPVLQGILQIQPPFAPPTEPWDVKSGSAVSSVGGL